MRHNKAVFCVSKVQNNFSFNRKWKWSTEVVLWIMNCARRPHCGPGWKKKKKRSESAFNPAVFPYFHLSLVHHERVLWAKRLGSLTRIFLFDKLSFCVSVSTDAFLCIKCNSLEFGDIFYLWPLAVNMSLAPNDAHSSPPWMTQPPLPDQNALCGPCVCVRVRVRFSIGLDVFLKPPLLCVCAVLPNSLNSRSQTRVGKQSGWFPNISQIFCLCTRLHLFFFTAVDLAEK